MRELAIPQSDLAEFSAMPDCVKTDVRAWMAAMRILFLTQGRGIGRAIQHQARVLNVSIQTVRRNYDLFRKTHDWRVLVDFRKFPDPNHVGLPTGFVEWWKTIQMEYQRETTVAAARRELLRRYERIDTIPGYALRPEADPRWGHPQGWSYRNLSRQRFLLTKYEKKAVQIGRNAAHNLLPKVLTTRVGLSIGEVVMMDDQDYDEQVNFLGINRRATRPSGFNAIDVFSAYESLQGYKPTILNPDGSRQKLKQTDFEWFVVNYLTNVGYRSDLGTLIIAERGTSKAGREFTERMIEATGGKVTFDSSGLHRDAVIPGLFEGAAKGNPRFKALREGMFRLLREEMSCLPGATGLDRDHAPEGNYGREIENTRLLNAMAALPPDRARLFQLPFLTWQEFLTKAITAYDIINRRDWHALEGWQKLGFTTNEWRMALNTPWQPESSYLALPDSVRSIFDGLAQQEPMLWNSRKLSPLEVWQSRQRELTKVQGHCIPILLGAEHRREVRVTRDLHFIVQDQEIDPDEMWFYAIVGGRELVRGEVYEAYLNPFNATALEICDRKGRWLGTSQRVERHCKTDTEALQRAYSITRKVETDSLKTLAARGRDITKRELARRSFNLAVADGKPITDRERDQADELQASTFTPEEIADVLSTDRAQVELSEEEIAELCNL